MNKKFVRVLADVHCDWEGLDPIYRVYVNDELFAERTWRWTDAYLQDMLQIEAVPGKYKLRWELVTPHLAELRVENLRVAFGPACWEPTPPTPPAQLRVENVRVDFGPANVKNNKLLRIYDESQ